MPMHKPALDLVGRVDPASTALIVVDVQNDMISEKGVNGAMGDDVSAGPPMVERLKPLIESARRAGVLIVYIQTFYDDPVISTPMAEVFGRRGFGNTIFRTGSWGTEFYDGIEPRDAPNEIVVRKYRFSAFSGTNLDLVLRSNGIKTLVMTGSATEVCVESTAREGFFRDYFIVEAEDCVSNYSQERHLASQANVRRILGHVVPSTDIARAWDATPPGPRNWQTPVKDERRLITLSDRLDPDHTALVLIDLQNDFTSKDGVVGRDGDPLSMIGEALESNRRLLAAARAAGSMVIHVKAEYGALDRNVGSPFRYPSDAGREGIVHTISAADMDTVPSAGQPVEVCVPGTWGAEFASGLEPVDGEEVVVKNRFSAFADTRLDLLLRTNGIRSLVIGGVMTNCCVESTIREAVMRDYYVTIARDGVATKDVNAELHKASLETLGTYFARVEPTERLSSGWAAFSLASSA